MRVILKILIVQRHACHARACQDNVRLHSETEQSGNEADGWAYSLISAS